MSSKNIENEVSAGAEPGPAERSTEVPRRLEYTEANDAWFISFAQYTVDSMLQRYGISTCSDDEHEPGNTLNIAA